jgi:hypothetical protein
LGIAAASKALRSAFWTRVGCGVIPLVPALGVPPTVVWGIVSCEGNAGHRQPVRARADKGCSCHEEWIEVLQKFPPDDRLQGIQVHSQQAGQCWYSVERPSNIIPRQFLIDKSFLAEKFIKVTACKLFDNHGTLSTQGVDLSLAEGQ